jgi:hypothetical protein
VVNVEERDFTGGPVVNISLSNAGDMSSIPGWGVPHPSWSKTQNIKQKQHCNKFSKDFRNGLHKKKKKSLRGFSEFLTLAKIMPPIPVSMCPLEKPTSRQPQ